MIEDGLASLDDPLELQTHILDRVSRVEPESPYSEWIGPWMQSDEREQVLAALARLSQKITNEVYGRWKDVLGSDIRHKEIVIEFLPEPSTTKRLEVFLSFKIKDGLSTFKISERSLGIHVVFLLLTVYNFFQRQPQW